MSEPRKRIIVFASGTKDGGGSGFENLVAKSGEGSQAELDADIIGVISNHQEGGVWQRAKNLSIPFYYMPHFEAEDYHRAVQHFGGADVFALSGWVKFVRGLDPARTINIHPALLTQLGGRFGGEGMHGIRVHRAVHAAFQEGHVWRSGITMHFVTQDAYDVGPIFFELASHPISAGMSAEDIQKMVNELEHEWQPRITNLVAHRIVRLENGKVIAPDDYKYLPKEKEAA